MMRNVLGILAIVCFLSAAVAFMGCYNTQVVPSAGEALALF